MTKKKLTVAEAHDAELKKAANIEPDKFLHDIVDELADTKRLSEMHFVNDEQDQIEAVFDHPQLGKMTLILKDSGNLGDVSTVFFKKVMGDKSVLKLVAPVKQEEKAVDDAESSE